MGKVVIQFFVDVLRSFYSDKVGMSARKLSAFAAMMVAGSMTFKHCNDTNLEAILPIWLLFCLLCLGIVTLQQIVEFKSGKANENKATAQTEGQGNL